VVGHGAQKFVSFLETIPFMNFHEAPDDAGLRPNQGENRAPSSRPTGPQGVDKEKSIRRRKVFR
jgi:hypothetical protein